MKKTLFSALICAVFTTACAQQAKVSGNFPSVTADSMSVTLINSSFTKQESITKVPIVKGKFEYTVDINETRALIIYPQPKNGERMKGYIQMYLVPNTEAKISGTIEDFTITGAKFYDDWQKIRNQRQPIYKRIAACNQEFADGQKAGLNVDSLRAAIIPRYQEAQKELSAFAIDYIRKNPGVDASVTLYDDLDESNREEAFNSFTADVRKGVMSGYLNRIQESMEAEKARKAAAEKIAPGKPAPDFTLNDIKGNPFSLSSLRGKYVVIDFWGSWCVWCIKGMPKMKEYYAKYPGKFEIVGVDCNDTDQQWKEAVAKHELPWVHVYNPRGGDVPTNYAVTGYPTKIMIDPEGNIARVIVGEDPSFYDYLDELFSK